MNALRNLPPSVRGSLLIVIGASFAGILGPLARNLYDHGMTPLAFVVWRGLIAGGTLWLLVVIRRRRDPVRHPLVLHRLPRRERLALAGFVVSNVVLNTSLFIAFDRIPIAVALLTFYTYPVLLAVYGRITGTETLGPIKVAALAISLLGLGLVVSANFDPASGLSLDPAGVALAGLSSLSACVWIGFGRSCPSVPAEQAMGFALTFTVAVVGTIAVLAAPVGDLGYPLAHPDAWPTVLVSGLLSGAGAAVLFTMGMRLISRVRSGILALIEPIMGTVGAAIILGQLLTPIQLLGGAFVLGAAVLIQREGEEIMPEDSELPAPAGAI